MTLNPTFEFIFKCFFEGVLFAQLVYVILHLSAHSRRLDYLYYLLYLACSIAYFLYKDIMFYKMDWKYGAYPYPHDGINYVLANMMHLTYLKFAKHLIGTKSSYPKIHRTASNLKRFIFAFIILNVLSMIFFKSLVPPTVQYVYSGIVAVTTAVLIWQMFLRRNKLITYVIFGSVMYALGSLLSLIMAVLHLKGYIPTFTSSLTVTQIGCMLEVLCFTAGLAYKSLEVEQERNSAQIRLLQQMKQNHELNDNLQRIRNKISEDLHDDVGGTLTAISVYSDVAQKFQQRGNTESVTDTLRQIGHTARQTVQDMQDIIWMINPKNDSAVSLYDKIHAFATAVTTPEGVTLYFEVAEELNQLQLDMQLRRDIYLLVKESVNNAVKHAACRHLWICFTLTDGHILFVIKDDGRGFPENVTYEGNGLSNLKKRTKLHRGQLSIETSTAGSTLRFQLSLQQVLLA